MQRLVRVLNYRGYLGCKVRMPAPEEAGQGLRHVGVVFLAFAVAASSLTFNWVILHRGELNTFPEFAGLVVYLSDILLFLGLSIWSVGWYLSPSWKPRFGVWYVLVPWLMLVVLTVLSIFWAHDPAQAGYTALHRTLLLALYLVIASEQAKAFVPMLIALFSVGLLHAGVALAQVAEGTAVGLVQLGELHGDALGSTGIGSPRAYGLGFNPNPVGLFLAVVSVLAYGLFLQNRSKWWTSALIIGPFIVTFLGMRATESRSALMGWVLGLFVVGLLAWIGGDQARATTLKRIGIILLLVFTVEGYIHFSSTIRESIGAEAGVTTVVSSDVGTLATPDSPSSVESIVARASPIAVESVSRRFTSNEISLGLQSRFVDWQLSLPISRDNIGLGVGAGNYPLVLKERLSPDTFGGIYTPPHSVPLLIVAELGVLGVTAWLLIMAAPLIWILSRRKVQRFEFYPLLWLGPLLVLLLASLWDFPPWATQDGRVLMVAVLGLWAGGAMTTSPTSYQGNKRLN